MSVSRGVTVRWMYVLGCGLWIAAISTSIATAASYDVSVTKSANKSFTETGETIQYTITLDNAGPDTATNMTIVDYLDSDLVYQDDMGGTCSYSSSTTNLAGDEVTTDGISLGASSTCTLTYSALVDQGPTSKDRLIVPGRVGGVTGMTWQTVSFDHPYHSPPVVVATVITDNNGDNAAFPAVRNVTTGGFEIAVCVDDGGSSCASSPSAEDIDYFVINLDVVDDYSRIDAGLITAPTDGSNTLVTFNTTFGTAPLVWSTPQTYSQAGDIAATVWIDDITTSAANLLGCTHQGTNNGCDSGQPDEQFGYLAIDVTAASIATFAQGSENISNSDWTSVSYASRSEPYIMVTQNDDDGGQDPQYPQARNVTSTSAEIRYCEQDGPNDCDNHTDERVVWFSLNGLPNIQVRNDAQLTAADDTNADNDTDTLIIPHAVCGNGVVDLNETCDDGNTVGGDGCAADCGVCVDGDSDGACASVDCDDSDNLEYPGQTWYKDADTDNYGDGSSQVQCARPSNHYVSSELIALSGDCNDNDAFINPTTVWYKDLDGDGYGDGVTQTQCNQPADYYLAGDLIATNTDCDDTSAAINPTTIWYLDGDGDAYSDGTTVAQCNRPVDHYLVSELSGTSSDCDDSDGLEYPGQTWWKDLDSDTYSDGTSQVQCTRPANYYVSSELTATGSDCNDSNANEYPGQTRWKDLDGDDYGDNTSQLQCARPTDYYLASELTSTNGDCDDDDVNEYPGQTWWKDADADDFGDDTSQSQCTRPVDYYVAGELSSTDGDCDDTDPDRNPAEAEVCDGVDNNCNGSIDEGGVCTASTICTDPGLTVPESECDALQAFFSSLNGGTWSNKANRMTDPDVDSWYGVDTIAGSGTEHVSSINLVNNNLVGSIPNSFGALPYLSVLALDTNTIVGVGAGIGNLTGLDVLTLDANNIASLPGEIGGLSDLDTLSIENNLLTSLPAGISGLVELDTLLISDNAITGLPDQIGELIDLDLLEAENNQIGSLPSSIGNLTDLDALDLDYNDLVTLPSSISNLSALDTLALEGNDLSALPDSFAGMSDLDTLIIRDNNLVSLPSSIGMLSELDYLYAGDNALAALPESMSGLTSLIELDLRNNNLTTLPAGIGGLTNMETVFLQNNQLVSLPDQVASRSSLVTLHLNDNNMTSLTPALGSLSNLRFFYAYDNAMTGTIPASYTGLSLFRFYIYNNNLEREIDPTHYAKIPPELSSWFSSIPVRLYDNQGDITPPVVSSGADLGVLLSGSFEYSFDIYEGSYPVDSAGDAMSISFGGAAPCTTLTTTGEVSQSSGSVTVDISAVSTGLYQDCTIMVTDHGDNISASYTIDTFVYGTDPILMCLHPDFTVPQEECEALIKLYQETDGENRANSTNWLSNTDVETWFGVRTDLYQGDEHVDGLFLHKRVGADGDGTSSQWIGNGLVGTIPDQIGDLQQLRDLNLSVNTLTGIIPTSIGNFDNLQSLYLMRNDLTGVVPSTIGELTQLDTLHLGENQLAGSLPVGLGDLTNLEVVDLSLNQFDGAIITGLGNLGSMRYLRLNGNLLDGEIPSELGDATALRFLYLNDNDLIGTLPASFANLTSMDYFYIQDNNLDRLPNHNAEIPTSLSSRYASVPVVTKDRSNQGDISSPILTQTGSMASIYTGPIAVPALIDENSYAVDTEGDGMVVTTTGDSICTGLSAQAITTNTGLIDIILTTSVAGVYSGCGLWVTDHAALTSNIMSIPTFTYADPDSLVCYDVALTIPTSECEALVDLYQRTAGNDWNNATNWTTSTDVSTWYGITVTSGGGSDRVSSLDLRANNLSGNLPSSLDSLTYLELLDLSDNKIGGSLPSSVGDISSLLTLNLSGNQLAGTLPTSFGGLTNLQVLNLSHNQLGGSFPLEWSAMSSLVTLNLSTNNLTGSLPVWFDSMDATLTDIILDHNTFYGTLPLELEEYSSLNRFDVSDNFLDRDNLFDAKIPSELETLLETNTAILDLSNQSDSTPPVVTSTGTIPSVVTGAFSYDIQVDENSFIIDQTGSGLAVTFDGTINCRSLTSAPTQVTATGGDQTLLIIPESKGDYLGCIMHVRDHGGNTGSHVLDNFTYEVTCGDGEIQDGETCDEGRRCDDGRDCTDDISICPGECSTRFINSCNPGCRTNECGDGYVDPDGADNATGTFDDESCDEGSYCDNGVECTDDPSICPTGSLECLPRNINGCNAACIDAICGDGERDAWGADEIEGTADDEECDDGNLVLGDGCTNGCKNEFCGDGYYDPDGADNISGSADDEECDDGQNNGLLAGLCSTTCELPSDNCAWCREYCEGGTGKHSIFLLIDISGSMGNNDKLAKAVSGAKQFLNLIEEKAPAQYDQGDLIEGAEVGLIAYESDATLEIDLTDNYDSIRTALDNLTAGGSTNFADALDMARVNFDYSDLTLQNSVVFLSDGEPTAPTTSDDSDCNCDRTPHWHAMMASNQIKNLGVKVYTIAYDQDEEGVLFMKDISSNEQNNQAFMKPVTQSSDEEICVSRFFRWCVDTDDAVAERVNDRNRSQSVYSLTQEDAYPRWEVDLSEQIIIDEIRAWNRNGSTPSEMDDYYIHISDDPFASNDLPTTLADPDVESLQFTSQMGGPSEHDINLQGRYVRVQLDESSPGSARMGMAELMVFGCEADAESCGTGYNYIDYEEEILDLLFSHIFGAIFCGCTPDMICNVCGDGFVQQGEECDPGSFCDDMTECTGDPQICPNECAPRYSSECTNTCELPYCGDGTINSVAGSTGVLDLSCGSGTDIVTDPASNFVLTGGSCNSDLDCLGNNPERSGAFVSYCHAGSCAYLQQSCFAGTSCEDDSDCSDGYSCVIAYDEVSDPNEIATCVQDSCVGSCSTGSVEACDDGNNVDGDGCSSLCLLEYCGDGELDVDGPDNYRGNGDDEQCDDGNNIDGDDCSATCQVENPAVCGDGILNQPTEECDDGNTDDDDGCSNSCEFDAPLTVPVEQGGIGGSCIQGRLPQVMRDEILPLWWNLVPSSTIDYDASSCADMTTGKYILGSSMLCQLRFIHGSDPTNGVNTVGNVPCTDTSWMGASSDMLDDLAILTDFAPVLGNGFINLADQNRLDGKYGQYEIILDRIDYTYCNLTETGRVANDEALTGIVCHMRTTITDGLLLQKGASLSNVANTDLSSYMSTAGTGVAAADAFGDEGLGSQGQYKESVVNYLTDTMIDTYAPQAVVDANLYNVDAREFTKVPNKEIYFYEGSSPLTITDLIVADATVPFTLVVTDADLIVEGSLAGRGMYIVPNGSIEFRNTVCDQNDIVAGMFIAGAGFTTSTQRNDDLANDQWCDGGKLVIKGLLVGAGIDTTFAKQRRTGVDFWDDGQVDMFHNQAFNLGNQLWTEDGGYKDQVEQYNLANGGPNSVVPESLLAEKFHKLELPAIEDLMQLTEGNVTLSPAHRDQIIQVKQQHQQAQHMRREKLFEGASVRIETDPQLWNQLPPGAKDYLEQLEVYK